MKERQQLRMGKGKATQLYLQRLENENGARIKEAIGEIIKWIDQDGEEHQTYAPVLELREGLDPLQYTVEE
jgi:hypothetical protein